MILDDLVSGVSLASGLAVAAARKVEELVAWRLCMELNGVVAEVARTNPLARNFALCAQMRKAAQAAPALIAEGFLRFTPEEFVRYLRMARAELGEVQTHLEIARNEGLLSPEQVSRAATLAKRAMAVTTLLLKSKLPLLKPKRGSRQRL